MIVHNAATLGDISRKLSTITDVESVREYFDANVVSCLILNNIFLKLFPSSSSNLHVIVNISSGAAHSSKNGLHLYGTGNKKAITWHPKKTINQSNLGKAARDAIFRGIAQESPQLRVLTYSPGPVATDMQKDLAENAYDEELKAWSHGD